VRRAAVVHIGNGEGIIYGDRGVRVALAFIDYEQQYSGRPASTFELYSRRRPAAHFGSSAGPRVATFKAFDSVSLGMAMRCLNTLI
jgi:hypothetical protein